MPAALPVLSTSCFPAWMERSLRALRVPSHRVWPSATIEIQESFLALMTTLNEPFGLCSTLTCLLLFRFFSAADFGSVVSASCVAGCEAVVDEAGGFTVIGGFGVAAGGCAGVLLTEWCSATAPVCALCLTQTVQPVPTSAAMASRTGTKERLAFSGG